MLRPFLVRLRRVSACLLRGERPLSALFHSVGTQAFIVLVNVLTGVITARLLGPEGRGVYAAVTFWPQLLATLAIAGLNSAIVFRLRKFPEAVGGIAAAALLLGVVNSLIISGVGVVVLPMFMRMYPPEVVLLAQMCLVGVLVSSVQMLIKQTFAGIGQFGLYNLSNLMPQLFYLLSLLAIIPVTALTATDAIVALIVAGFFALLMSVPRFVKLCKPCFAGVRRQLLPLMSYSARAVLMDMVFALATYADRLVLIPLLPASQLGFYAVAFSFSRVIQLVQPAIISVIFSHMSRRTPAESKQLHDHACSFLLAGLVIGCAALWMVGGSLLVLTYGAEFAAANVLFQLLVVEASLGVLSQVTVQLFLSLDRPGVVSTIQVIVLCLSLALLLVLVPHYGATGAAVGLVGAAFLRWLLLLGALKIILKLELPRLYLTGGDLRHWLGRLR